VPSGPCPRCRLRVVKPNVTGAFRNRMLDLPSANNLRQEEIVRRETRVALNCRAEVSGQGQFEGPRFLLSRNEGAQNADGGRALRKARASASKAALNTVNTRETGKRATSPKSSFAPIAAASACSAARRNTIPPEGRANPSGKADNEFQRQRTGAPRADPTGPLCAPCPDGS
jgi:hypothetical protein